MNKFKDFFHFRGMTEAGLYLRFWKTPRYTRQKYLSREQSRFQMIDNQIFVEITSTKKLLQKNLPQQK